MAFASTCVTARLGPNTSPERKRRGPATDETPAAARRRGPRRPARGRGGGSDVRASRPPPPQARGLPRSARRTAGARLPDRGPGARGEGVPPVVCNPNKGASCRHIPQEFRKIVPFLLRARLQTAGRLTSHRYPRSIRVARGRCALGHVSPVQRVRDLEGCGQCGSPLRRKSGEP